MRYDDCCGGFGQDDLDESGASTPVDPNALTVDPDTSGSDPSYTVPSVPLVFSPASMPSATPPDPSDQYSKYFTLAQLTPTSLPFPNLPLDQQSQDNLKQLGVLLDAIQDNVGTFTIASAYRSPANQASLQSGAGGAAAASMAVSHSLHSSGQAADITPANGMSATQFAQAIYNNPLLKTLCGQLCDKSEGGHETSLHLSTIITTGNHKFFTCTPMYVNSAGGYVRMTPSEIGDWMSSKAIALDALNVDASDTQESEDEGDVSDDGSSGGIPWGWIAGLAAVAAGGYFFVNTRKSRKTPGPGYA